MQLDDWIKPGTATHKAVLALLTSGLLAGTLSSTYASYKAFMTPDRTLGQFVLGWVLAAVGLVLLGMGLFFGRSLFADINRSLRDRRRVETL